MSHHRREELPLQYGDPIPAWALVEVRAATGGDPREAHRL